MAPYNFVRRLEALGALTPCDYICKIWASEHETSILNLTHQMSGPNSHASVVAPRTAGAITVNDKDTVAPAAPYAVAAQGDAAGTNNNGYLAVLNNNSNANLVDFGVGTGTFAAGGSSALSPATPAVTPKSIRARQIRRKPRDT